MRRDSEGYTWDGCADHVVNEACRQLRERIEFRARVFAIKRTGELRPTIDQDDVWKALRVER